MKSLARRFALPIIAATAIQGSLAFAGTATASFGNVHVKASTTFTHEDITASLVFGRAETFAVSRYSDVPRSGYVPLGETFNSIPTFEASIGPISVVTAGAVATAQSWAGHAFDLTQAGWSGSVSAHSTSAHARVESMLIGRIEFDLAPDSSVSVWADSLKATLDIEDAAESLGGSVSLTLIPLDWSLGNTVVASEDYFNGKHDSTTAWSFGTTYTNYSLSAKRILLEVTATSYATGVQVVPEPASALLFSLGIGVIALGCHRRRTARSL